MKARRNTVKKQLRRQSALSEHIRRALASAKKVNEYVMDPSQRKASKEAIANLAAACRLTRC